MHSKWQSEHVSAAAGKKEVSADNEALSLSCLDAYLEASQGQFSGVAVEIVFGIKIYK